MILWVGWVVILGGNGLPGAGCSKVASFPYLGLQLGWPLWLGPSFMRLSFSWRLAGLIHMVVTDEGFLAADKEGQPFFKSLLAICLPRSHRPSQIQNSIESMESWWNFTCKSHIVKGWEENVWPFFAIYHISWDYCEGNIGDRCESVMKIRSGPVRRSNASQSIVGINI